MALQNLPFNVNIRWALPALGGIGVVTGLQVCYTAYRDATRYSRILNTFDKGSCITGEYANIRSQEEIQEVKAVIIPSGKIYSIVTGQRGLGKSVLVQHLVYHTPGVLLLTVPVTGDNVAFGRALANTIGFSFDEGHSIVSKVLSLVGIERPTTRALEGERSLLERCLHALGKAAEINNSKGKPPLVLVLDDVNQIIDEEVVGLLQRTAKSHADRGDLLFVFVASEGRIPRKMAAEGDQKRFRIYEVGEITKASAKEYMVNTGCGLSDDQFERLFEATGGIIGNLVKAVAILKSTNGIDEGVSKMRQELISSASADFSYAGMLIPRNNEQGWEAVRAILEQVSRSIPQEQFYEIIVDPDIATRLLSKNVFAQHYRPNRVSMQSAAHVLYAKGVKE